MSKVVHSLTFFILICVENVKYIQNLKKKKMKKKSTALSYLKKILLYIPSGWQMERTHIHMQEDTLNVLNQYIQLYTINSYNYFRNLSLHISPER